jgi:hypothetical protein
MGGGHRRANLICEKWRHYSKENQQVSNVISLVRRCPPAIWGKALPLP